MPLEELLARVKRWVHKDRKYMDDNNYFMEEEPKNNEKPGKDNVVFLKKPSNDFIPFSMSMLVHIQ